jgi:hypothetical protein
MRNRKIIHKEVVNTANNDFKKIYIYVRNWKLLSPVPYVFKIDFKKIKEILN